MHHLIQITVLKLAANGTIGGDEAEKTEELVTLAAILSG
jgi:hypothetical protein